MLIQIFSTLFLMSCYVLLMNYQHKFIMRSQVNVDYFQSVYFMQFQSFFIKLIYAISCFSQLDLLSCIRFNFSYRLSLATLCPCIYFVCTSQVYTLSGLTIKSLDICLNNFLNIFPNIALIRLHTIRQRDVFPILEKPSSRN